MASCPPAAPGVSPELRSLALAGTILYPLFVFGCWFWFALNRQANVFLRKRSFALVSLACLFSLVLWSCTALYDYLGPERYPCALYAFLYYISTPMVGGFIMLQGHLYLNSVSAQTLARLGSPVEGKVSCATMTAHFKAALCANRQPHIRVMNAQFTRTKTFWAVWMGITMFPYVLTFLIRLASDPVWNSGCWGCRLSSIDYACLISINTLNMALAYAAYSFRVRKRDSLRILRQCAQGIVYPMPLNIIFQVLAIINPNNLQENGGFNLASGLMAGVGVAIYAITVHQVLVARSIKRKILFSENVDREDRLADVLSDKALKAALENYLVSELSAEIMSFMEAVQLTRARFAASQDEGMMEARVVFGMYIEKNRAKFEVNLPARIRDEIALKMKASFDSTIFDEAYADVRSNFLRDGFPRFLHKLKTDPSIMKSINRKTNYSMSVSSAPPKDLEESSGITH